MPTSQRNRPGLMWDSTADAGRALLGGGTAGKGALLGASLGSAPGAGQGLLPGTKLVTAGWGRDGQIA